MNYYKARQRKIDTRWDFTCCNDDNIYPVGYCHPYEDLSQTQIWNMMSEEDRRNHVLFKDKYHSKGHDTAEEANQCYKQYLLDQRLRFYTDPNSMKHCEICKVWTLTRAWIKLGVGREYVLCPEHASAEYVKSLFEVAEFWSS